MSNQIPCEIYSRVSGYMRPVGQWNKGKQEEKKERKEISLKGVMDAVNRTDK